MPECAIMGAIHISKCLKTDDILVKDDICNLGPYSENTLTNLINYAISFSKN